VGTSGERSVIDEVPESTRTRRRWPLEEKLRIVLETLEPGVSVPVVARRHSVNANQLFIWRSQHRRGELIARSAGERQATLVPVQIEQPPSKPVDLSTRTQSSAEPAGAMEIQFPGGQRVKVWGCIDAKALRILVRELLRPC
jgi:transposase